MKKFTVKNVKKVARVSDFKLLFVVDSEMQPEYDYTPWGDSDFVVTNGNEVKYAYCETLGEAVAKSNGKRGIFEVLTFRGCEIHDIATYSAAGEEVTRAFNAAELISHYVHNGLPICLI